MKVKRAGAEIEQETAQHYMFILAKSGGENVRC